MMKKGKLSSASESSGLTISELVYEELRRTITTGVRAPGSRLVETEIARTYGVSRTPVRSALSRLQLENLAMHSTSRGLVVTALTREEVEDIYAVRSALEGFAAKLAAYVALPRDIDRLERIQARIDALTSTGELALIPQLNYDFHTEIHQMSRNATLLRFMSQIYANLRRYRGSTIMQPGRAETAAQEHRALIEAIRQSDHVSAERIAREHIESAQRIRVSLLDNAYT